MSARLRRAWLAWLLFGCVGGARVADAPAVVAPAGEGAWPEARAEAWPEADDLFRRDPRWRGGDAALSIDLGGERVLWLFGDSFVAAGEGEPARARSVMVRNSVAVQHGRDPANARIRFHWREGPDGAPRSFFPEEDGGAWFWPAHGSRSGGALTIFLHRIEPDGSGPLGFRSTGWRAVRIDDPDADPSRWTPRALAAPETDAHGVVGAAVVADAQHVYALGVHEPGDHAGWLARWTRRDFDAGDLTRPEYWRGRALGFGAGAPAVVLDAGATEMSVSALASGRGFVQVQSHGFGVGAIALRFAPALTGPWSAPREVFRPPEAVTRGVLCYAGKAHPELVGADLVVTYACNATDPTALLADETLYYPRFVRVALAE